ncbi:DUF4387 family protein [Streptomyces sp. NPDC046324]|uniref:DUF4387 family protein n=1 Tax=Streptomyces sp. NPDC046324 TaxID=3154915 RepID=UPI0033CA3784
MSTATSSATPTSDHHTRTGHPSSFTRPGTSPQQEHRFLNNLFATLYNTDPEKILLVNHPLALAVKVSLPRPTVQGDRRDTDCYAGQQYAPLLDMEVAPS